MAYLNRAITAPKAIKSLTAATTLTAAESGKTLFLNLAGGFTVTLPAVAAGLEFNFIVGIAPTTEYVIASAAGDIIMGQVFSSAGADEDSEVTAGADYLNFVANTAVISDSATMICDGTYWYAKAFCNAAGGCTFTG